LKHKQNNNTPMNGEIFRKMIHYSSAAISIGYYFIDKNIVLAVTGTLLFLMIIVELVKYKNDFIYRLYLKFFKDMLREHEYDRKKFTINGATWVFVSCFICILIFPKLIAIMGMLMLSFADSTAGILGRLFGKKQYAPNRSYIGTLAFFIAGLLIIVFTPMYNGSAAEYAIRAAAVVITTFAEAFNLHIDDNFTIPIVGSVSLYVLYTVFTNVTF